MARAGSTPKSKSSADERKLENVLWASDKLRGHRLATSPWPEMPEERLNTEISKFMARPGNG